MPGNEKTMTRLCTNLPRTPFSLDLVSRGEADVHPPRGDVFEPHHRRTGGGTPGVRQHRLGFSPRDGDRKTGRLRAGLRVVGVRRWVITYERD
ncbi:MAG: hypothetical protein H0V17_16410 [Deltaproteobacteria bacterium]|nr:hypothetical protein [Deltaproteobacteria bacterium]